MSAPDLDTLGRLEIEVRYLGHYWGGRRSGPRREFRQIQSYSPADLDRFLKPLEAAPLVLEKDLESFRTWRAGIRRHLLTRLGAAEQVAFAAPGAVLAEKLLRFADRHGLPGDRSPSGSFARLYLAHCHNLALFATLSRQAAAEQARPLRRVARNLPTLFRRRRAEEPPETSGLSPALKARLLAARDILDAERDELLDTGAVAGDLVSALFALEGLGLILMERVSESGELSADDPWREALTGLPPVASKRILVAAGMSPFLSGGSPVFIRNAKMPPGPGTIAIGHRVRGRIEDHDRFTRELTANAGDVKPGPPFVVGEIGAGEIKRFTLLESPSLGGSATGNFRGDLLEQLGTYERKLFATTVMPLPGLFNQGFDWVSERALLPLSGSITPAGTSFDFSHFVHRFLRAHLAERELARTDGVPSPDPKEEEARKARIAELEELFASESAALEELRAHLGTLQPDAGDIVAIRLAMEGLRAALSRAGSGVPDRSWPQVLAFLSEPRVLDVLLMATWSPQLLLLEPELERAFADRQAEDTAGGLERWRFLQVFLSAPGAEPGRREALSYLEEEAVLASMVKKEPDDEREDARDRALRILVWCMEREGDPGAEFVGRFLVLLFRRLCGDVSKATWGHRARLRAVGRSENSSRRLGDRIEKARKRVDKSTSRLRLWFLDFSKASRDPTRAVSRTIGLVVDFCERCRNPLDPTRSSRTLETLWSEIVRLGLSGLTVLPWGPRARRLLAMFWLDVCRRAVDRKLDLRLVLPGSNRGPDDGREFGARLYEELVRERIARERRRSRIRGIEATMQPDASLVATLVEDDSRTGLARNEKTELKVVRYRLDEIARAPGAFRTSLLVRRVLVRRPGNGHLVSPLQLNGANHHG